MSFVHVHGITIINLYIIIKSFYRTTPEQAVSYVVACVILQNLGIQTGDVMDRQDQPADAFNPTAQQVTCNSQEGSHMRD